MLELTTKEAVLKVLSDNPSLSKYRLAQLLGVRPIMINNYIREVKPCKMSVATAVKFHLAFAVHISDIYNPIKRSE